MHWDDFAYMNSVSDKGPAILKPMYRGTPEHYFPYISPGPVSRMHGITVAAY